MKKGSFWIKSLPVYIAILLGSFLIGWFSQSDLKQIITPQGVKNNPKILLNQLLACPPGESSSSYKCTVPLVNAYLKKNNVEPLFELIKKEYKTNPEVGNYCHPLGHTIGRAMYQKYGYVDSLNMCDPFCAAGCTMGVMESFLFANKEIHPTNDRIMEKADEACEEFAQGNIVKQAACIHGTGHGIMPLVLYKTQDALDLCKMLHSAQKGSCYDAVFMEKFLPTNPVRKVSKTKDLFEYCSHYDLQDEQKKRCFGYIPYAWQEWGKKPEDILKLCSASQTQKDGCGRGIVRLYLPEYVKNKDMTFFETYKKASKELKTSMEEYGAIYMVEYMPSDANHFCNLLKTTNDKCVERVKQLGKSMDIEIP